MERNLPRLLLLQPLNRGELFRHKTRSTDSRHIFFIQTQQKIIRRLCLFLQLAEHLADLCDDKIIGCDQKASVLLLFIQHETRLFKITHRQAVYHNIIQGSISKGMHLRVCVAHPQKIPRTEI